jgi:hypothetical protein
MVITEAQIEAASAKVQITHGKAGRARDIAFLAALGLIVKKASSDPKEN